MAGLAPAEAYPFLWVLRSTSHDNYWVCVLLRRVQSLVSASYHSWPCPDTRVGSVGLASLTAILLHLLPHLTDEKVEVQGAHEVCPGSETKPISRWARMQPTRVASSWAHTPTISSHSLRAVCFQKVCRGLRTEPQALLWWVSVHQYVQLWMCVCEWVWVCDSVHWWVCIHVSVHLCVNVWAYLHDCLYVSVNERASVCVSVSVCSKSLSIPSKFSTPSIIGCISRRVHSECWIKINSLLYEWG